MPGSRNRPVGRGGSGGGEVAAQPTSASNSTTPEQQAESIRDALRCGRHGCSCNRSNTVHCPSHIDNSPSFSVTARNDTVLVHCHAGCDQDALITELKGRGLWRVRPTGRMFHARRRVPGTNARCPHCHLLMWWPDEQIGSVWWWCEDCEKHVSPREALVEWYEYPNRPESLRRRR